MLTKLSAEFENTAEGKEAEALLRKCVHCGFCNATCPTYQLQGDELDGPRGRIYLIKQMLEGGEVTRSTQVHLDRCLTCRNCETTCPSGVQYGRLADIGRRLIEARVNRPMPERITRWLLKEGLTSPLFAPALRVGQRLRPLLPRLLRDKVPLPQPKRREPPGASHDKRAQHRAPRLESQAGEQQHKVLLLRGCVQPAMRPQIDRATIRVLGAAGYGVVAAEGQGCCGALHAHLADHEGGLEHMRRNIDAWWPLIESGSVEAIVINASGCSQMVKEYGYALREDTRYAARAARVATMTRDLTELLPDLAATLSSRLPASRRRRIALHAPCTLQHGQRVRGWAGELAALGFEVQVPEESHLCCGSAGTYSVLQPELARRLRDRKLGFMHALGADCIASANIGCIQHLQSGTDLPVRHWIELLDEALADTKVSEISAPGIR